MRHLVKRVLKFMFGAVAAVVVVAGVLCLTLWLEHNSSLELPLPTGQFAVGRMSTTWIDSTRVDPFAPDSTEKRALVVWIWYPATAMANSPHAEYLPKPWPMALANRAGPIVTQFFFRNPAKVRGHSLDGPPVARANAPYPVVIFNSGIGALSVQYASIIEDLVSHGYIVIGTDRPYSTSVVVLPDGRVIHNTAQGNPGDGRVPAAVLDRTLERVMRTWTADSRFVLDRMTRLNASDSSGRLTGTMNLNAVGIMGHSIGGATAAQFCHDDDRCRAGVDIDGRLYGSVVPEGIGQPFLFLLADYANSWTSATCEICANIRSAASRNRGDKLIVTTIGAQHFSFGDQILTQSSLLRSALLRMTGQGRLNAREGLASTSQYLRTFFDVHLRNAPRQVLYAAPLVPNTRFEK